MGVEGGVRARALGEGESLLETISFFLPADADEGDALDADTDDCFFLVKIRFLIQKKDDGEADTMHSMLIPTTVFFLVKFIFLIQKKDDGDADTMHSMLRSTTVMRSLSVCVCVCVCVRVCVCLEMLISETMML